VGLQHVALRPGSSLYNPLAREEEGGASLSEDSFHESILPSKPMRGYSVITLEKVDKKRILRLVGVVLYRCVMKP